MIVWQNKILIFSYSHGFGVGGTWISDAFCMDIRYRIWISINSESICNRRLSREIISGWFRNPKTFRSSTIPLNSSTWLLPPTASQGGQIPLTPAQPHWGSWDHTGEVVPALQLWGVRVSWGNGFVAAESKWFLRFYSYQAEHQRENLSHVHFCSDAARKNDGLRGVCINYFSVQCANESPGACQKKTNFICGFAERHGNGW